VRKKDPRVNHPSFPDTFRQLAVEFGVQYYLAARYAVVAQLVPVCGSLAHHAIEMLLKACLAKDDPGDKIAEYRATYGHKLDRLWREFRTRNSRLNPDPAFDALIGELDRFEDIRYPDPLVLDGGNLDIGLVESDPPTSGGPAQTHRRFTVLRDSVSNLLQVAATIKNDAFAEEREIRFISPMIEIDDPRVAFRVTATGRRIPYVHFSLANRAGALEIDEIMVGPGQSQDTLQSSVTAALEDNHVNGRCRVTGSHIPYREI
jgi:hypothetical protein